MGRFQTSEGREPRVDRKTLQLCRQIERALVFAISETGNDLLLDAQIEGVVPAPDAGHLLVQVSTRQPKPFDVLVALQAETPRLRKAAAEAITRRKAPELAFQVVQPGAAEETVPD